MNQSNSVFMPGLNASGPVYNGNASFGALPNVSPMVKYAIIGGLLYFASKKKIPMLAAASAALAVWKFLPDAAAATVPVTTNIDPTFAVPIDTTGQVPDMPNIAY